MTYCKYGTKSSLRVAPMRPYAEMRYDVWGSVESRMFPPVYFFYFFK